MHSASVMIYHAPHGQEVPGLLAEFAAARGLRILSVDTAEEVLALVNRSYPACIVMHGGLGPASQELCRQLKSDAFTAIVPVIFLAPDPATDVVLQGLDAGADEVLTPRMDVREQLLRIQMTLHRADRDVSVNPTTRLPGTVQIERDIAERLRSGELFAVCYADLDHFKEFNDRYGYNEGDRVILLVSRILRDVVKAHAPGGFIGHIGGDDFIFNVPLECMRPCCEEIIEIFDELIPYQYEEEDRRLGYFLGKDRRGNILKIPLMTLSIGVVTNQYRRYTHTARVSELATEMKAYAKSLPGSVYAVDRRRDVPVPTVASTASAAGTEAAGPT
ncbi:MAG TPA: diguanylate cyclase [Longimicrobiales bacterium]